MGFATQSGHESMTWVMAEAAALLDEARTSPSGRTAHTLVGGSEHVLRQTLIALVAYASSPTTTSPASVQVLLGSVELHAYGTPSTAVPVSF
jgi:hypothetical protein